MCPSSDPRLHRSPVTWGQHKTLHTRRHTQGSTLLPHRQCHEHHLGPRITAGPGAEQAASAQGSGAFPLLLSPSVIYLLLLGILHLLPFYRSDWWLPGNGFVPVTPQQ